MIDNNPDFQRLVRGISLADRFMFYIPIADAQTTAQILESLQRCVSADRGEPVRLVTIAPTGTSRSRGPGKGMGLPPIEKT